MTLDSNYDNISTNTGGGGGSSSYYNRRTRPPICYVCRIDLLDEEIDFYPCNCKYSVSSQSR